MIGGSAVVSRDSPPAFGNLLLYRDDIVPWLRRLADDVHEAGAAVMCQVTHLGRRTSNFSGDWLPLVYPSPLKEPAHRSFPKARRELGPRPDHRRLRLGRAPVPGRRTRRHRAPALRPPPRRLPLPRHQPPRRRARRQPRAADGLPAPGAPAVGPRSAPTLVGVRMSMDEDLPGGLEPAEAPEALRAYVGRTARLPQPDQGQHRERRLPGQGDPVAWARRPRRSSTSPARSAGARRAGDARRPDLRRGHRPATRCARACSTWSG